MLFYLSEIFRKKNALPGCKGKIKQANPNYKKENISDGKRKNGSVAGADT